MTWWRRFVKSGRVEHQLDSELRFHLEQQAAEYVRAGMGDQEARRKARMDFGGMEQVKEECRDARGARWVETLIRDLRFALRTLAKSRGFSLAAVATIALGIGANTAIFTVVYATLLAPSPYPQPDQLVIVWSKLQGHRTRVSVGDFIDWRRQSTVFEDLNAWGADNFNIATQDRPEFIDGMEATPGYYGMLGSPLFLGRNFLPEEGESGKEHVVILTHRLWRHLGANPQMIGQTMQINGEPFTVVGVLAPGTADRWDEELIVPLAFKPEQQVNHDSRYRLVTGRLKHGVTITQAQAEMDAVTAKEAKDYPKSNQGWGALVEPFKNAFLPGDRQWTLRLLLGAVGFLLLIACVNVANLLLAKGITRQREVAIRGSLGAGPVAIFAQFLTESLVLAILGGLLGVAAGYAMLRGLVAVMPPHMLSAEADLRLNVPILLFMLAAAALAGVLFGCAPAWYASRLDLAGVLKEGGRSGIGVGSHRLRWVLVIAEFALALPLLAGAGLAIHSLWNLTHVDLGAQTDHILSFYLDSVPLERSPNQVKVDSYYRRILTSIQAVPGVSHVCAMTFVPLDSLHTEIPFTIAGQPEYANPSLRPIADLQTVTPDYFQTFGIRIVKGRAFTDYDDASSVKVAMVNEAFANRYLRGVDPLRQRVVMEQVYERGYGRKEAPTVEWQIVGVFHTVKSRGFREDDPEIDVAFEQMGASIAGIGVRTAEDPASMIKSISAAVNAVDSQAALALTRTMEQVHDEVLANDRFTVILFASFAVVALLLAAIGIYGLMAYSVEQRTQELGIRLALGAKPGDVRDMVVSQGMSLALIGVVAGVAAAFGLTRLLAGFLFGVQARDPITFVLVPVLLSAVALLAVWIPARRATRINPADALRWE